MLFMKRLSYLDAIRGIMAIVVVLNHNIVLFFTEMYWYVSDKETVFSKVWRESPLHILTDGNIAVQYFYVLSGFLVALAIFNNSKIYNIKSKFMYLLTKIKNRYFRFLPMVFIAIMFAFILLSLGCMQNVNLANDLLGNKYPMNSYYNYEPNFFNAIYQIFIEVFISDSIINPLDGPFWTIHWEFIGTIITLIVCLIGKSRPFRRLLYILVSFCLFRYWYPCIAFMMGAFVADLYYYKDDNTTWLSKFYSKIIVSRWFIFIALIIGLYFSLITDKGENIYFWFNYLPKQLQLAPLFRAIGITILMYVLLYSPKIQKKLQKKPLLWLGSISFPVYALHFPLQCSVECGLFYLFYGTWKFSYVLSWFISFIVSMVVIIVSAYYVNLLINRVINPFLRKIKLL